MRNASGPIDSAGIAAALRIMDVDITDVRVRKHPLNDLLDLGTFNHISVQHHADLIKTAQRKQANPHNFRYLVRLVVGVRFSLPDEDSVHPR